MQLCFNTEVLHFPAFEVSVDLYAHLRFSTEVLQVPASAVSGILILQLCFDIEVLQIPASVVSLDFYEHLRLSTEVLQIPACAMSVDSMGAHRAPFSLAFMSWLAMLSNLRRTFCPEVAAALPLGSS